MPLIRILAKRPYRHLLMAQVSALLGTGIMTVALSLLAYRLAEGNAGAVLGTALACKMVAYVGVAPIAGALVCRVSRRVWLVVLDVVRAAIVMVLPFVDQAWQIYVLIFFLSACSAASTPVFQAIIPDVLPDEDDYTEALSLSRLAYELENLLSPAIAAVLLSWISFHWLFAGTALGFFVSALLIGTVAVPAAARAANEVRFLTRLTAGMRVFLVTPRLRGLLALNLAVAIAGAMIIVNTVVYVRTLLGGNDHAVAWAYTASGMGATVAALMIPRLIGCWSDRRVMLTGSGLMALGLALAVMNPGLMELLVLWGMIGAGSSLVQTPIGRLLTRTGDKQTRQGLFTAQFTLSHACWLLAYPLAGWLGAELGMAATFVIMAIVVVLASFVARALWPVSSPI